MAKIVIDYEKKLTGNILEMKTMTGASGLLLHSRKAFFSAWDSDGRLLTV